MSSLWDESFEKQKANKLDGALHVCSRCNLPYPKTSKECEHCAHLEDHELEQLRENYKQQHNVKKIQTRLAIIWSLVIAVILMIIFIIAT